MFHLPFYPKAHVTRLFLSVIVLLFLVIALSSSHLAKAQNPTSNQSPAALTYHTYATLQSDLTQLQATNPAIAKLVNIGTAEQGRTIWAIKISDNVDADEAENRLLFTGAHHAREWISVEVPFQLAKYLIEGYSSNESIKTLVNNQEIWIVPMLNPDGHVYTQTARCWRKNRRDNGLPWRLQDAGCQFGVNYGATSGWGVDPNRNYGGPQWGGQGSSGQQNNDTYHGTSGFSEPETQAIRNLMNQRSFVSVLSYHSFSQLILYPWGYTNEKIPQQDFDFMSKLAKEMSNDILAASGKYYTPQQSIGLYPTTGDLTDWTYDAFKIPSFTIELRPTSNDNRGFDLPADEIEPTWLENKNPALRLLNLFNLDVESPRIGAPAFVGPFNAPQKFEIKVKGEWRGKTNADFTVKIGGDAATVAQVTRLPERNATGTYSGYLLQVVPPQKAANGLFDLEVTVGGATSIEKSAVNYGDAASAPGASVSIAIDRSPSMYNDCDCPPDNPSPSEDRIGPAKNGAKQFVDLMQSGDQVAIIGFDGGGVAYYTLSDITSAANSKEQPKNAVDSISMGDSTSIGSGLVASLNQLDNRRDGQIPAIVILSDGFENAQPYVEDVLQDVKDAAVTVYSIGVGRADSLKLSNLASATGGKYYFAATPQALTEIYNQISSLVSKQQIVQSLEKIVQQDAIDETKVMVDSSIREATFLITWGGSDLDLTLQAPNGQVIDPAVAATDANIEYQSSGTLEFYRVKQPQVGQWTMRTKGVVVDSSGSEPYNARLLAKTELPMGIYLDGGSYTDDSVKIAVTLADTRPISTATVSALIRQPNNVLSTTISLFDDGSHGDVLAGDGTYTNYFTQTTTTGNYQFSASAVGVSSVGQQFTRQVAESLFVAQRPSVPSVVAPPDVVTTPGMTVTAVFTVINTTASEASFDLMFGPVEEATWADLTNVPTQVTLAGNQSVQIPVTIHVPEASKNPAKSSLSLVAINQNDPAISTVDSMTIAVPFADLAISISGPPAATPKSEIGYTVVYSNQSAVDVANIVIVASLSENIEYVSDSLGNSVVRDGTRQWFIPSLPKNAQVSFDLKLRVSNAVISGTTLSNVVGIMSGMASQGAVASIPDSNTTNNSANFSIFVAAPNALDETEEPVRKTIYLPLIRR